MQKPLLDGNDADLEAGTNGNTDLKVDNKDSTAPLISNPVASTEQPIQSWGSTCTPCDRFAGAAIAATLIALGLILTLK